MLEYQGQNSEIPANMQAIVKKLIPPKSIQCKNIEGHELLDQMEGEATIDNLEPAEQSDNKNQFFKNETKSVLFIKFVGLKSKMHSLVKLDKEPNKAKSVNKDVVEKMKYEDYVKKLFPKKRLWHNIKTIQSKLHEIRTYHIKSFYHSLMINVISLIMKLRVRRIL